MNQLTKMVQDDIITTYHYDPNGNLLDEIKDGKVTSYSYDGYNRLTSVQKPDDQWMKNHYNPLSQRTAINENGIRSEFVISGNTVTLETDAAGNQVNRNIVGYQILAQDM